MSTTTEQRPTEATQRMLTLVEYARGIHRCRCGQPALWITQGDDGPATLTCTKHTPKG